MTNEPISVKYGLLLKGKLVRYSRHVHNANNSYGETTRLDDWGIDGDWLVDDLDIINAILAPGRKNPMWYNAHYENPIVEIDLSKAIPVQVTHTVEYTPLKRS